MSQSSFVVEGTEAQRGEVVFPRSHRLGLRSSDSKSRGESSGAPDGERSHIHPRCHAPLSATQCHVVLLYILTEWVY